MNLESQLRETSMELADLQNRYECEISEYQHKIKELSNFNEKIKGQSSEKDRALAALQRIKNGDTAGGMV